jgi:hypothetical protein
LEGILFGQEDMYVLAVIEHSFEVDLVFADLHKDSAYGFEVFELFSDSDVLYGFCGSFLVEIS